jgi:hypothetical protein
MIVSPTADSVNVASAADSTADGNAVAFDFGTALWEAAPAPGTK